MYLGVDIGGTKTLVAVFNEHGEIRHTVKIPTPQNYDNFMLELRHAFHHLPVKELKAAGIAVPGRLDRKHGRVLGLGNLQWLQRPIASDCERIFNCPVVIENDANLAALSESMLHKDVDTVLYFTVSTGIGTGVVYKQRLDPALLDTEGGHVQLPHKGKYMSWEKFASGRAIYEHYGKKAMDIPASDEHAWRHIARNLALGMFENIVVVQPDLVIIGGSIGTYFDRYGLFLKAELQKYQLPIVVIPEIVTAQRPEEAVVYGCYDLAKQTFGHAHIAA